MGKHCKVTCPYCGKEMIFYTPTPKKEKMLRDCKEITCEKCGKPVELNSSNCANIDYSFLEHIKEERRKNGLDPEMVISAIAHNRDFTYNKEDISYIREYDAGSLKVEVILSDRITPKMKENKDGYNIVFARGENTGDDIPSLFWYDCKKVTLDDCRRINGAIMRIPKEHKFVNPI